MLTEAATAKCETEPEPALVPTEEVHNSHSPFFFLPANDPAALLTIQGLTNA
jgi:hypothetical protein